MFEGPRVVLEAGKHGAGGLVVFSEVFCFRVPIQFPAQEHCDVADVADGGGAMAELGWRIGWTAMPNGIGEIEVFATDEFVGPRDDHAGSMQTLVFRDLNVENLRIAGA